MLIWLFSFFTVAIAGHMKLLGHQKLDSICTISYVFTAFTDPASVAKESVLNPFPPKKSKIHTKYKDMFSTSKWPLHFLHTGMCGSSFMVWNYVI